MTFPSWLIAAVLRRHGPRSRPGRRRYRLCLEQLEDRTLLNGHTLATATPLPVAPDLPAVVQGTLPTTDFFAVTVTGSGLLTATVHTTGAATRLSLLGPDGALLIQSDGQSAVNGDDRIAQHVEAGSYFLEVQGLGAAAGGDPPPGRAGLD